MSLPDPEPHPLGVFYFPMTTHAPSLPDDVLAARLALAAGIRRTPCMRVGSIGPRGTEVWLKREDLQRTGSFKERGARNALLCLNGESRRRGVVAASAGNHALGLAYHGQALGIPVTVVMPRGAPRVKVERCRGLGARIIQVGDSFSEAEAQASLLAASEGLALVHPFDDPRVMAGQGTLALEALDQVEDAQVLVVPVGGGGLLAGAAAALCARGSGASLIAVEPEGAASLHRSLEGGEPVRVSVAPTLADGLAVACVARRTLEAARPRVSRSVTVGEDELASAIGYLARTLGIVAEGAGAAAFAAVLFGKCPPGRVIIPITGRNIDPAVHARILAARATPSERRAA